jgi:hypothetical protein
MPTTPLLPLPDGLEITAISKTLEGLLISVTSHRPHSPCPLCGTPSRAIHSYYRRRPLDLPCAGQTIRLQLCVRKFFCRVPHCSRHPCLPKGCQHARSLFADDRSAAHGHPGYQVCFQWARRSSALNPFGYPGKPPNHPQILVSGSCSCDRTGERSWHRRLRLETRKALWHHHHRPTYAQNS